MGTHVKRVVAFGASAVCGVGAPGHGWVQRLERQYNDLNSDGRLEKPAPLFYNLGIYASTSSDLRDRAEEDLTRRIRYLSGNLPPDRVLSIVSLGVNDAWVCSSGESATPIDKFRRNMKHIIGSLASHGQVLYVGPATVDERKISTFRDREIPPLHEALRQYEEVAAGIVREAGGVAIRMVNVTQDNPGYLGHVLEDGLHADGNGYTEIWRKVAPVFETMVGVEGERQFTAADLRYAYCGTRAEMAMVS